MELIEQNWWMLFLACLFIFLSTGIWMQRIANGFIILPANLKFSMFELELPASESSLRKLILQMDDKVKGSVRRQLLVDYIFMLGCYVGIALLCYKTSMKMVAVGKYIFLGLAALQVISWICDIVENIYLFDQLKNTSTELSEKSSSGYRFFQFLVKTKFILAFVGAICSLFGLLYFWIIGDYSEKSLPWLAAMFLLILLSGFVGKALKPKKASAE